MVLASPAVDSSNSMGIIIISMVVAMGMLGNGVASMRKEVVKRI
jgi:hypothetical protein